MYKFYINLFSIFFLAGLSYLKAQGFPQQEPPNVVIIIADDISRDDFGCYGHPVIETPNIDRLAENGMRFDQVFLTTSSCSPSRVSIITGRYPHNTGAPELHSEIPEGQVFFPKKLKEAGYYTAQAGKWHFGSSPSKPAGIALEAFHRTGGGNHDGGGVSGSESWVKYLKERPREKPFFMWFASHDAHRGWDNKVSKTYLPKDVVVPPYMVDNQKTREDLVSYYQEVSRFDFFVGKVVEELKGQGVLENTMVIVMADNGRPFPRDKTRLYDSGIMTPFVVHFPNGIKKSGQVSNSLISTIDIAPSIIELTGADSSDRFQGISFLKVLEDPQTEIRKYVFAEHNWHDFSAYERMVRSQEFLYIENSLWQKANIGAADVLSGKAGQAMLQGKREGDLNELQNRIFKILQPKNELYEVNIDTDQFNNLSGKPAYQEIETKMKKILSRIFNSRLV